MRYINARFTYLLT